MALCSRCTYPSIHFFVSRSWSVVDCANIQAFTFLLTKTLSRSRSVVWCVVCCFVCVCTCGVVSLCVLCDVCVHVVVWCCVVLCCRQHTNQHGVQLRGVIWRELHSTSFSARNVVTHVTILPSSPLPLLHHHHPFSLPEKGNFLLQEYFRRGIYFLLQFYLNSKKSPPGKITVITVLY